jgi:adenylylsulfate kinase
MARDIIGEGFVEVFVNCPIEVCAQRDVKGLYAKVSTGEINDMTGIGSDYEAPTSADLELRTDRQTEEESVNALLQLVGHRVPHS